MYICCHFIAIIFSFIRIEHIDPIYIYIYMRFEEVRNIYEDVWQMINAFICTVELYGKDAFTQWKNYQNIYLKNKIFPTWKN